MCDVFLLIICVVINKHILCVMPLYVLLWDSYFHLYCGFRTWSQLCYFLGWSDLRSAYMNHYVTDSLTHSLTDWRTDSLTDSLTYSLTHLLNHSITHTPLAIIGLFQLQLIPINFFQFILIFTIINQYLSTPITLH